MLISWLTVLFYFSLLDSLMMLWAVIFILLLLLKNYLLFYDGVFFSDFLSFSLIFISLFVFSISLMSSSLNKTSSTLLWVMLSTICLSFFIYNGLAFYLLFEFSFVIMFTFLMNWGIMFERVQASFYMFFYTLIFSLPLLILILEESLLNTLNFFLMFNSKPSFLWIFMMLVFIVKLPLFSFHLWLPKAHVEAPVAGSMILAGVLLKLGGFGLIRFYPLIEHLSIKNNLIITYLMLISIIGGVLMNCVCMRQTDLKMLIAYSSIVHMSLVYLSAISFSFTGQLGCILMMVAHGLISPVLFYLMTILYLNTFSRSMYTLKGNLTLSPSFTLFWFISCALNFGFPPFMSFYSEILITMSLSFLNIFNILMLILFFFLTGTYCIFMYTSITHGESLFSNPMKLKSINSLSSVALLFFVLLYPLMFFIY